MPSRSQWFDDRLVLSLGQAVMVLDRGDGHDPPGPFDLLDVDLGDPDVADLARVPTLLDRAEALLELDVGIDAVQVVERDGVRPQLAQALVDLGSQDVGSSLARVIPTLGAHHDAFRCG